MTTAAPPSLRDAFDEALTFFGDEMTARDLLEYARERPESPVHAYVFRLGVDDAAEVHYLDRCGRLIRKYYIRDMPATKRVRQMLSVPTPEGRVYRRTELVVRDEFATKLVLQEMEREIQALKRRYGHLAEFAEAIRAEFGDLTA